MPPLGYALLGAGSFGAFCIDAYGELQAIQPRAVVDSNPEAAQKLADEKGLRAMSVDEMLTDASIDLVHIATPPFTHAELGEKVLRAGKHLLCEKPLATRYEDGERLLRAARENDRMLAVNLIMRYDPLLHGVDTIIKERLLGEPLRATFENYAKDENLGPKHWFWDVEKSGGIFVEHAVHFFALFDGWFGRGERMYSFAEVRPGSEFQVSGGAIEAVGATIRNGKVVTESYHSFTQATYADRQEFRILFERGEIRMTEWVPTTITVEGAVTRAERDRIAELIPNVLSSDEQTVDETLKHRWKEDRVDFGMRLKGDVGMSKDALYKRVVRDLLQDNIDWIADHSHVRRVTPEDALESLRIALECRAEQQLVRP